MRLQSRLFCLLVASGTLSIPSHVSPVQAGGLAQNPLIRHIGISGNTRLPDEAVRTALRRYGLVTGQPYDPQQLERALTDVVADYRRVQHAVFSITPILGPHADNTVALNISINDVQNDTIEKIVFYGNRHIADKQLKQHMSLKEDGAFAWFFNPPAYSATALHKDLNALRQLYLEQGYYDFSVTRTTLLPGNPSHPYLKTLIVDIHEGPRYRWGNIDIDGPPGPAGARRQDVPKPGQWYRHSQLTNLIQALQDRMQQDGYALGQLVVKPARRPHEPVLDMRIEVQKGQKVHVGQIHIAGLGITKDRVVRRELQQAENADYDADSVRRSIQRLERTGLFEQVQITAHPSYGTESAPTQATGHADPVNEQQARVAANNLAPAATSSSVDLTVRVKERTASDIYASAGWKDSEGFVGGAGAYHHNLWGLGHSASVRLRRSQTHHRTELSYRFPYVTRSGLSLTLRAYHDADRADQARHNRQGYRLSTRGLEVIAGLPVQENERLDIGLGAERLDLRLKTPYYIPKPYRDFIHAHGSRAHILTTTLNWQRDRLDNRYWPTRGYQIGFNLRAALPGGDLQFATLQHNQQWYFPLSRNVTLSVRGGFGYGTGYGHTKDLPYFYRLKSGGPDSVRGYENDSLGAKYLNHYQDASQRIRHSRTSSLGGRYKATASIELLFPVPGRDSRHDMRLSVFTDAGSVWDRQTYSGRQTPYADPHRSTFSRELRFSTGLGVSWHTSLGSLRLSYALPWRKRPEDRLQQLQLQITSRF